VTTRSHRDLSDPFGLTGSLLDGQYRVDDVIGEGGFGVVYRGRHLSLDQPIAIKVLKGLDGGEERINALVLEKFRAEARLLYTLSQSSLHIVRALDFGATTTPSGAWAPFMILEWLEGQSLADDLAARRLRGLRGRSLAETTALLEPVANGLGAAHKQSVVHRDVKPANIFLLRDPSGPRVKVLDFGIAKIMKEGESAGTKGTFASFTWLYAAPEQLDPRFGATDLATDVYAFGLLLTELLTDRAPIDAQDVIGIMRTATDVARRPTPRTLGANIPDAVEAVCRRALSVHPRDRYANVTELWSAFVAAHGGRESTSMHRARASVIATPPPTPSPLQAMSPPRGTRPPGALPTASVIHGPPPGTPPPGTRPSAYGMIPPPTTMPPRFVRPFIRQTDPSIIVITIMLFVGAALLAGSCALVATCANQQPSPASSTRRIDSGIR
jgi:eukaryotic-like serine/threonine-protein kinase